MVAPLTPPAVRDPEPGDVPIDDLIDRAADLKGELLAFAETPRFARRLKPLLVAAAGDEGVLDEATAVATFDHFALQHRLEDGRTVVERFVAQRRPRLADGEREMVLGWRDVVEGCFEVCGFDGDGVRLHNLIDDLVYPVYSNMGRGALSMLRTQMFVVGRIVPLHPATEAWLVSGHFVALPKSARKRAAKAALEQLAGSPGLMRRNSTMLRQAWEMQAEQRAEFIAQVGSDLVILPPRQAQETVTEHYDRLRRQARQTPKWRKAPKTGPAREELGRLPEALFDADTVALVYDEVEGLNLFPDFGRLDALFADPTLVRDRACLNQLGGYLRDDSVSPLAIRRLVSRHPDGADPVFRALLRKPGFSWARDGEKLLQRHKKRFLDLEPTPSVSVVGARLADLLGITA